MTEKDKIVVDSYAWIEYFEGTKKGKIAGKYIDDKKYDLITPVIVVAELSNKFRKKGLAQLWETKHKPYLELFSTVIPLEKELGDLAGLMKIKKRKKHKKIGLADCIVLATNYFVNGRILTGDPHFNGEKTIFIE